MGVNPRRKDVLLEYDWFVDSAEQGLNQYCPAGQPHSHRPSPAALASVTAMFAAAPVSNSNGVSGINVIHDYGQGGLFTGGTQVVDPTGTGTLPGHICSAVYDAYYNNSFAANRKDYFHYVLMPHRYTLPDGGTNSSGAAESNLFEKRDEIIVSLYCQRSDDNVAKTIAHELGHNLILKHGGDTNCNFKPNYNSIMNYRFSFPGIDTTCDVLGDGLMAFSTGNRIALDETNLNEAAGVCGNVAIDWDGNGATTAGVQRDLNPGDSSTQGACGGVLSTLTDHNDWANIIVDMTLNGNEGGPPVTVDSMEICPPVPEEMETP